MINKVLLGLIAALAIGIVVVGSADKARQQPAAAITALSETVDTPVTAKTIKADTSISATADLSTFVSLAGAVGLTDILKEKGGEYTIFAPTNAAFEKFAKGGVDALLATETKSSLTALMTYHVVPGHYSAKELTDGTVLTTVQGDTLTVSNIKGVITINGVGVVTSSETTVDGSIVHIVNNVLTSSTDGLMTETTGPSKDGEEVATDATTQTLCTDNKDGTVTLQAQEYSGWWIFASWHNKGDATTEKGSCADYGLPDMTGLGLDKEKHRDRCVVTGTTCTQGIQIFSGWWIFGGWEFAPGATTIEFATAAEAKNHCDWYNEGKGSFSVQSL